MPQRFEGRPRVRRTQLRRILVNIIDRPAAALARPDPWQKSVRHMLISFSRKFVFIHVQRTAGGSLINALRQYEHRPPPTRLRKLTTQIGLQRDPTKMYFRAHEPALRVRRMLPDGMYEDFFSFAFVRNPYSWLVSLYEIIRQETEHRQHRVVAKMSGFREYLEWEATRGKRHQSPLLTDERGQVMVNYVGYFERLRGDYDRVCDQLDLPAMAALPHTHKRTPRDYREYYDDHTRELVSKHWHRDIGLFGYDFDGLVDPRPASI